MEHHNLKLFSEIMGFSPVGEKLKQILIVLRGEEDVPKSKFGVSSLRLLYPKIGIPMWRGKQYIEKKVILTRLFNHRQTPESEGWSVQRTQVQDFRGKELTYNSHNGTDLSVPVGTTYLAAAAGEVVAIKSEYHRGGLKLFLDHGNGLMTCSAHLAKVLVKVGDIVKRGQPIAITGYSGVDGFITFPFGIPHVHYNTWLNGTPVDPFPFQENISLWKAGKTPLPFDFESKEDPFVPSSYDEEKLKDAIASCKTPKVRERLNAIKDIKYRAAETIIEMNYYPTRFPKRINIYSQEHERKPTLDLPFKKDEYEGAVFLDDLGFKA